MGIAEEDIERVRAAVPLVDVVRERVALRRVGRRWVGLCPFHAEKSGSFNVNEELGFYKCFGCGAKGDVITFVRETEHLEFAAAVERLAGKAGITLRYTTGGEGLERSRRARLVALVEQAVEWYHQRLLQAPDARPARDYLRSRGIDGATARTFRLGWAPDEWDALSRSLQADERNLREAGLAFVNRRDRLQDVFRARLLFPIFTETGDAVGFGGRVLPGSSDPAKYKNSAESSVYAKSRILYGLNWAKAPVVAADRVVVCEGYTDVIGFHQAGVPEAVATCGTALTEDHVRLLRRFARRVVLAFDADAAGQGAAERFYQWERTHDVEVGVVRLPDGLDPADLARRDPAALARAVDQAEPFLGFRLHRVLRAGRGNAPEQRARTAAEALGVVAEHPDVNVRTLYAGEIAAATGLPVADIVAAAKRGAASVRATTVAVAPAPAATRESGEVACLWLLLHRWDDIAPWLSQDLFADETCRRAFQALANGEGDFTRSVALADPDVAELLERLAVVHFDLDPDLEACNLIAAAVRRSLARVAAQRDPNLAGDVAEAKLLLDDLERPDRRSISAERLLRWLERDEQR